MSTTASDSRRSPRTRHKVASNPGLAGVVWPTIPGGSPSSPAGSTDAVTAVATSTSHPGDSLPLTDQVPAKRQR